MHFIAHLKELFSVELNDGICLERDWYKVANIWCESDMDETDDVIEAFRRAAEQCKEELGDKYHIYKAVKSEIDKWNPYCLLSDVPYNEFNLESERVACLINYDSLIEKIVKVVSRVFSEAFEPQYFTAEKCMDVAVNIRKALDGDRK